MKKAALLAASVAGFTAFAIFAAGGASATTAPKAGATVITMEQDGRELYFDGPATVAAGTALKIKNKTNPQKIGPHTFSLVKADTRPSPDDKDAIKACERKFKGICGAIARWHKVDFEAEEIGRNPVEVGKDGWSLEGDLKRTGDSWFAFSRGESFKRDVSADPGDTLTYFCAIHAVMQGEIEVTE